MPDYSQLKSILLSSGIQQKNNPLYQVIDTLIGNLITTQKQIDVITGGGSGSLTNVSVLTQKDETGTLPNSLQEIAGSGIQISDIGKRRIISAAVPISFNESFEENYENPIIQGPSGPSGPIGNTGLVIGLGDINENEFEPNINFGNKELWKLSGNNIYYSDGNVGIGTNNPNTLLHIATPAGVDTVGQFARFNSGSSYFRRTATTTDFMGTSITPGNQNIRLITAVDINNSEVVQLYVDAVNSRIGIGNSAPTAKLDVSGDLFLTAGNRIFKGANWVSNATGSLGNFGGSDVGFYIVSGGKLQFVTNGANVAIIDGSGNVGINTTSPTGRLHIIDTTLPLKLGYDTSNYTQFFLDSSGNFTISTVGTSNPNIKLAPGANGLIQLINTVAIGSPSNPLSKVYIHMGGADQNLRFLGPDSLADGVTLQSLDDANVNVKGMEFEASKFRFSGMVGINVTPSASKLAVVGLPTSTSGLVAGDIWVDTTGGLNILKIV